ncbi:hypothetical protein [Pseudomonas sp. 2822-17]|uniref:hypothetical protein n=1 Tax=Pseudomonas sp. 2822-17 TaxID=1712678 RepID=UPI001179FD2C|nr:hypothetical protein [Pseudomonas sp. 2822-17]
MANPNPYKDVNIPPWIEEALNELGERKRSALLKHIRFLQHSKEKFEKAAAREYNRRRKIERIILDDIEIKLENISKDVNKNDLRDE